MLLFINTKWNVSVPQWVWVLAGRLKAGFWYASIWSWATGSMAYDRQQEHTLAWSGSRGCSPELSGNDYTCMATPARNYDSLPGLTKSGFSHRVKLWQDINADAMIYRVMNSFFQLIFCDSWQWVLIKACGQSYWKNMLLFGRFGVS